MYVFVLQSTASLCKKIDHNIGFQEKRHFLQKLGKIVDNCDHNIEPRLVTGTATVNIFVSIFPILQMSQVIFYLVTMFEFVTLVRQRHRKKGVLSITNITLHMSYPLKSCDFYLVEKQR
jgi:hypothetical protein